MYATTPQGALLLFLCFLVLIIVGLVIYIRSLNYRMRTSKGINRSIEVLNLKELRRRSIFALGGTILLVGLIFVGSLQNGTLLAQQTAPSASQSTILTK